MKKGFTLVELSIVLVVIGLLIGGIVVGQSLVDAAKISALINESQQFEAEIQTFKSKYKYLPGDYPSNLFGIVCGSGGFGNGDGIINTPSIAWVALNLGLGKKYPTGSATCNNYAQYVGGAAGTNYVGGINSPKSGKWKDVIYYFDDMAATSQYPAVIRIGGNQSGSLTGTNATHSMFTSEQVAAIDQKIDDSLPSTGIITAIANPSVDWWSCNSATGYKVNAPFSECGLAFNMRFK